MALVARLLGTLAAGAACVATGNHIPVLTDGTPIVAPPDWPRWPQPLLAWAFCVAVLVAGAALAAAADATGRPRDNVATATGLTSSGHGGDP